MRKDISSMQTRREFIGKIAKGLCAAGLVSQWAPCKNSDVFQALAGEAHASVLSQVEARYYTKAAGKRVECRLCPWSCRLRDGERGRCRVRRNTGGTLYALVYGKPCIFHNMPSERTRLYHYLPRTGVFSIGTPGCNFGCEYCQSWVAAQSDPEDVSTVDMSPEKVIDLTKKNKDLTFAFVNTEPVVCFEYALDIARMAKEQGIKSLIITNGFIRKEPMKELCRSLTAVRVDFKGFTEKYYEDICHGQLRPVLDTMVLLKETGVWLELVVLLLPTLNDSPQQIKEMCQWIRSHLGVDVPVHFSRFHPNYKLLNLPPTSVKSVETARNIALETGLRYAYVGDLAGHEGENTYCPACKEMVIKRIGYYSDFCKISNGACEMCGQTIPGVWS